MQVFRSLSSAKGQPDTLLFGDPRQSASGCHLLWPAQRTLDVLFCNKCHAGGLPPTMHVALEALGTACCRRLADEEGAARS